MQVPVTTWLIFISLLGLMTLFVIWSRRDTRIRSFSVLTLVASVPLAAGAVYFCLGLPVPYVEGFTVPDGDYEVLGSKNIPQKVIYVLLDTGTEPTYISVPWSGGMSKQLEDAEAEKGEGKVIVRIRSKGQSSEGRQGSEAAPEGQEGGERGGGESSLETRQPLEFYPAPVPAGPDKQPAQQNILRLQ